MQKMKWYFLLILTMVGLVSCPPQGDPAATPKSVTLKPISGSVTSTPLTLEISVVYENGFCCSGTTVEIIHENQVVAFGNPINEPIIQETRKFLASIPLASINNGQKLYKARVKWVKDQTQQLDSAEIQVTIAIP